MVDSAAGLERTLDSPTYSPLVDGPRAVDRGSRATPPVDSPDPADAGSVQLVQLLKLAAGKQEAGEDEQAQELLRQALEIADRTLSPDDPDVVLLITDLTRLYLKNSAFESAEPLLLRLFEIKRSKGDDHPEVATVLASLATVRQSLGRHESAEQLWRRVLDIRERTLAPNHFAIATALESLGNSCAARGKIGEALTALKRALSIREKTLGAEHPSLRVSRERIADLRLQASEDFDLGLPSVTVTPEKYRLLSGEPIKPTPLATTPQRAALPAQKDRAKAPSVKKAAEVSQPRFVDLVEEETSGPAPLAVRSESAAMTVIVPQVFGARSEPAPYMETLESLRDEIEEPYQAMSLTERSGEIISTAMTFLGRKEAVVGMVVVVIGLLSVAVVTSSQSVGTNQEAAAAPAATQPSPTPVTAAGAILPIAGGATGFPGALDISNRAAADKRPTEDHSVAAKKTEKAPEKKIDTRPLTIPAVSTSVMSRLDDLASKASNASSPVTDATFAPAPAPITVRRSGYSDEGTQAPLRAHLIGDLPTPRVPSQAADVEGEVRLRFTVDTAGRPVMSSLQVVTSPNPLLTSAVRQLIPTLRFDPARAGGPDSKAIPDVVQLGFQFFRGR